MITLLGSLNTDLVLQTEHIPAEGETVLGRDFRTFPGGKGGNQAVAAARLGSELQMIGAVGRDERGSFLLHLLEDEGIGTSLIHKSELPTGLAMIMVDQKGRNAIAVAPGANLALEEEQLAKARPYLEESSILLAQLESPLDFVERAIVTAKSAGLLVILNPAPAVALHRGLLSATDILTPNETELSILSGGLSTSSVEDCERAGKLLLQQGVRQLIITRGSEGCLYLDENTLRTFPAYTVKPLDTTAAGDCFNGALAAKLDQGAEIFEAIDFAMKAAAISVTRQGAQPSLPRLEELIHFDTWYEKQTSAREKEC